MFLQGTIYANDLNDSTLAMPITEADFLSDEMLKNDDVVTFENAEILRTRFHELGADESKIEYDFGDYGSHRSGLLKFHMNILKKI